LDRYVSFYYVSFNEHVLDSILYQPITGMSAGSITTHGVNGNSSGVLPDGDHGAVNTLHFCCQDHIQPITSVEFESKEAFILYKAKGSRCVEIKSKLLYYFDSLYSKNFADLGNSISSHLKCGFTICYQLVCKFISIKMVWEI